jgi:hypothetical protein
MGGDQPSEGTSTCDSDAASQGSLREEVGDNTFEDCGPHFQALPQFTY